MQELKPVFRSEHIRIVTRAISYDQGSLAPSDPVNPNTMAAYLGERANYPMHE